MTLEKLRIKPISFVLLIVILMSFFLLTQKDLILVIFLLILNGILFNLKRDKLLFLISSLLFLTINIAQEFDSEKEFSQLFIYIFLLFCSNFIFPFFIGFIFNKIFRNKIIFHNVIVLWLFTFSLAQTSITFINKAFLDRYSFLVLFNFLVVFFIGGFYSSLIINKRMEFVYFLVIPIILLPIIFLTSKDFIKPALFLLTILASSIIGFYFNRSKYKT
ncbi:hypothetical protein [Chryseobacterium sp.]|uniref:hypothetical protein n=1 Tax=Chryseobacterium sp. TaxID=1871047 RepID=UPI002FCC4F82